MAKEHDQYPMALYRCPGPHHGGKVAGKLRTYADIQAKSADEAAELLKEGWAKSMLDAAKLEDAPKAAGK